MYELRLLHGGADAKALMGLTLLIPFYPILPNLPVVTPEGKYNIIATIFPFPIVILFNAVLLFIIVPLLFIVYNGIRKDIVFPWCLLGYRMAIDTVPKKFVWLMEKIDSKGKRVIVPFPVRDTNLSRDLEKLKSMGVTKVWVTPKFPFMVPLTIGLIIAIFFGFPPFLILSWLTG
jgi:preflagellin peptidase FlaK